MFILTVYLLYIVYSILTTTHVHVQFCVYTDPKLHPDHPSNLPPQHPSKLVLAVVV